MNRIAMYLDQLARVASLGREVTPGRLDDPTPCTNWNVRQLINHVAEETSVFARCPDGTLGRDDVMVFLDPARPAPDAVGAASDDAGAVLDGALSVATAAWGGKTTEADLPDGEMPGSMIVHVALADALIHGWDLGRALGRPMVLPEDAAAVVLDVMQQQMGTDRPEGSVFGPPVQVSDDAPVQDRLIAFSGRTP